MLLNTCYPFLTICFGRNRKQIKTEKRKNENAVPQLISRIFIFRIGKFCNQRDFKGIETVGALPCWMFVFCLVYKSRLTSWAYFKGDFLQIHSFNTDFYNILNSYKGFSSDD